jgi:hypothetical protein
MTVWTSIFGWKAFFRWDVLGSVVPGIFVCVGIGLLTVDWFPHNLLIAQASFTIAFALVVVKILGHAVEAEGSQLSRALFFGVISLVLSAIWWISVRNIQIHKNTLTDFSTLTRFLARSWVQHVLWMGFGMVVLVFGVWVASAWVARSERSKPKRLADKGFLDFKIQAEKAMSEIGRAITPITAIMTHVGTAMERLSGKVGKAASTSTQNQIRITKKGAESLDSCSRKLEGKLNRLEQIGSLLQEGLIGWYTWANNQEVSRVALSEATPSLESLCRSIESGLQSTDSYIGHVDNMKGVSRDLNEAIGRHVYVMRRIRDANREILIACRRAIQIIVTGSTQNPLEINASRFSRGT